MNLKQKTLYGFIGFVVGNALLALTLIGVHSISADNSDRIDLDEALSMVESGSVRKVHFREAEALLKLKSGDKQRVALLSDEDRSKLWNSITAKIKNSRPSDKIELGEDPSDSFLPRSIYVVSVYGFYLLILALVAALLTVGLYKLIKVKSLR